MKVYGSVFRRRKHFEPYRRRFKQQNYIVLVENRMAKKRPHLSGYWLFYIMCGETAKMPCKLLKEHVDKYWICLTQEDKDWFKQVAAKYRQSCNYDAYRNRKFRITHTDLYQTLQNDADIERYKNAVGAVFTDRVEQELNGMEL